jgi:hypothetical protein
MIYFLQVVFTTVLYTVLMSLHITFLYLITVAVAYLLKNTNSEAPHYAVFSINSSVLRPNILLSAVFLALSIVYFP